MENNEILRLLEELREEMMKVMMEAAKSSRIKEILMKLEKKGVIPKVPEIVPNLLNRDQTERLSQGLSPGVKQTIKELQQSIQEVIKERIEEGMEDPQITEKMEELKKQEVQIKILGFAMEFALLVREEIPGSFKLDEKDREMLRKWKISWN